MKEVQTRSANALGASLNINSILKPSLFNGRVWNLLRLSSTFSTQTRSIIIPGSPDTHDSAFRLAAKVQQTVLTLKDGMVKEADHPDQRPELPEVVLKPKEASEPLNVVSHGTTLPLKEIIFMLKKFKEIDPKGKGPSQVNLLGCNTAGFARALSKRFPDITFSGYQRNAMIDHFGSTLVAAKSDEIPAGEIEITKHGKIKVLEIPKEDVKSYENGKEIETDDL